MPVFPKRSGSLPGMQIFIVSCSERVFREDFMSGGDFARRYGEIPDKQDVFVPVMHTTRTGEPGYLFSDLCV
jgi:hypothetical protein